MGNLSLMEWMASSAAWFTAGLGAGYAWRELNASIRRTL